MDPSTFLGKYLGYDLDMGQVTYYYIPSGGINIQIYQIFDNFQSNVRKTMLRMLKDV
jgi:hypothetical protein